MSIVIDPLQCKGCMLCIEECPKDALSPGKERSAKGYLMPLADDGTCVSCGMCEMLCPDQAISTLKKETRA